MRTIGVILVVLGILGFIVEGVSYTTDEQVADIGPVEVEAEKRQRVPIAPVAAGGAVLVGAGLFVVGSRRQTS
ncbi:MAG: DUF3185 domain-containing protein [Bacteroidetes bacterium]|nr:DUF3185 domain-containing protein [Bacteroidota bacterium]